MILFYRVTLSPSTILRVEGYTCVATPVIEYCFVASLYVGGSSGSTPE